MRRAPRRARTIRLTEEHFAMLDRYSRFEPDNLEGRFYDDCFALGEAITAALEEIRRHRRRLNRQRRDARRRREQEGRP